MSFIFSKMTGNGNDFIIADNRDGSADFAANAEFVKKVCARRLSVGADGLILIENSEKADFKWRFYNSDGTEAAMCGNGARCAARYAYSSGIAGVEMTFETGAGMIEACILDGSEVKVLLTPPSALDESLPPIETVAGVFKVYSINTGVPHAVAFVKDVSAVDVNAAGSSVRRDPMFAPDGTNVNFVSVADAHNISVRTFERGVEGETLACGTGCVASALASVRLGFASSPVRALTAGGKILTVYEENGKAYLQGEARFVYSGELSAEALDY